ncbi:MAG: hypothetical protein ACYC0Q_06965 [Eubacteriales bacterium]
MENKKKLQSCIQHCQTASSDIKSMSAEVTGSAKQSLDQASQSIDACIKQCQSALSQIH